MNPRAGLVCLAEIIAQAAARDVEKRANQQKAAEFRLASHAVNPRQARPAQNAVEDGLGLVIGMVGQEDGAQVMLGDHASEKLMPQGAIESRAVVRRIAQQRRDHVATGDRMRKLPVHRELAHEFRIASALIAARLVIQVNHVKLKIAAVVMQQVKQGHAVRAAGDRHGVSAGGD